MAQERGPDGKFKTSDVVPRDWRPYQEVGLQGAQAVFDGDLSPDDALKKMGLDPAEWEVRDYKKRIQPTADGDTRIHVSIQARPRMATLVPSADVEELVQALDRWSAPNAPDPVRNSRDSLVVALADWQIGKGEGGGTRATIDRVLRAITAVSDRVEELRAIGRPIASMTVLGLGDLVEGCDGWYPNQAHTIDLDNRGQDRVTRLLIAQALRAWAPLVPEIRVAPVGGNHGENRSAGKVLTGPGDNRDLTAFEIVEENLLDRPGYDHIKFQIPKEELSQTVDAAGITIGVHHGHLMSGGIDPSGKAKKWWTQQVFGRGPVSEAQILVTGHFHSYQCVEFAREGRTWIQCPAMDGGSQWFLELTGSSSPPGLLTFRAGESCGPRGWSDLQIL